MIKQAPTKGITFGAQGLFPFMIDVLLEDNESGWRKLHATERRLGQIVGLPSTHGLLLATTDAHALVLQNSNLLVVHKDWWQNDEKQSVASNRPTAPKQEKKAKLLVNKYLNL